MADFKDLSLEEQLAVVEDAVDLNNPTMQEIEKSEDYVSDIETAWEAYDVLKENMELLDSYALKGETPPDEIVAVATESMLLACNALGIEDFLVVSQERAALGAFFNSELFKNVAARVKDTYDSLSKLAENLITSVAYDVSKLSVACDIVKADVDNFELDDNYLTTVAEDARKSTQVNFSTLLKMNNSITTMDDLAKYLLTIEKSISMPRSTSLLSTYIQRVMPRANIDTITVTKDMVDKDFKTNMGINAKLNKFFYDHVPANMKDKIDPDKIAVVDFYVKKCGGFVMVSNKMTYTSGTVNRDLDDHRFKEPMSKRYMLELLSMAKRFSLHFEGFKSQVDSDIYSGKKVMKSLDNINRVIDDRDDTHVLNTNMNVVESYVRLVPHIANATIRNYFVYTKLIIWLVRVNYMRLEAK